MYQWLNFHKSFSHGDNMDTSLGRIRLSEQIEEAILKAIRSGEYPTGTKLPSERNLMEMFDVGRPSVKEALLMLERKGFVQLKRGIAPIVVEPTPQGAMDVIGDMVRAMLPQSTRRSEFYDLRIVLETAAAMQAARSCTDEDLTALEDALGVCRTSAGKAKAFRDADLEFHSRLVGIQENSVLTALHGALIEWGLYYPEKGWTSIKFISALLDSMKQSLSLFTKKTPLKHQTPCTATLWTAKTQNRNIPQ